MHCAIQRAWRTLSYSRVSCTIPTCYISYKRINVLKPNVLRINKSIQVVYQKPYNIQKLCAIFKNNILIVFYVVCKMRGILVPVLECRHIVSPYAKSRGICRLLPSTNRHARKIMTKWGNTLVTRTKLLVICVPNKKNCTWQWCRSEHSFLTLH